MERFVVSARKYRPSNFSSVVGQDALTTTLKNAIQRKQLAQAYLFCGPRGVGKTTCARIFAKTINCLEPTADLEACNQCESCKAFNEQRSFNIHELDAASNSSVEGIRSLIEQVRIPPQIGKYSVYIIDEVHMLSQQAFNAFLKTLEEPPAHAIFILATTEKHKIIPTILSRCQIYDFNRIKVEDIVKYLQLIADKESVVYEIEALNIIAQKADGAMRDALSIFDQVVSYSDDNVTYQKVIENLNVLDYQYFFKLTENFLEAEYANALVVYDELLSKGFDPQQFLAGLSEHFRDLLICKDPNTAQLLEVGAAIAEKYIEFATRCSTEFLVKALDVINRTEISFRQSSNQRLHVELMLIRLSGLSLKKKNSLDWFDESQEELSVLEQPELVVHKPPTQELQNVSAPKEKAPTPSRQAPKSISIKDTLAGKPQPVEQVTQTSSHVQPQIEDEVHEVEDPVEGLEEEFGQDEVEQAWVKFIKTFLTEKPRLSSLMQSYLPVLMPNHVLSVEVESSLQVEMFNELKHDLLHFLQSELENRTISIEIRESENASTGEKFYTDEDKYKYLSQINPNINALRQQLNLDFD